MKVLHNVTLRCCPFCGKPVTRVRGYNGLNFFKCNNRGVCGAVMSFDNDYCNNNPEEAVKQFNQREHDNLNQKLTDENEKLKAMVGMWRSTAYCEKDRNKSIKIDTVQKMKRDLYVEFSFLARRQKDNKPNMTSQEVYGALDKVVTNHLLDPKNHNLCVSCGVVIPEGRQVCPNCEK